MKINTGIPDQARKEIAQILTRVLADEYVLYTKTRGAHWNITGMDFAVMHTLFERQYVSLDEFLDEIAERIRALGHEAPGSLAQMLDQTRLTDQESNGSGSSRTFIAALLADHETIIRRLREEAPKPALLGDDATNGFLVGLMQSHEKMAWMLRASLG